MTDNDTRLLSEAYVTKILSEKALTPKEIAKKATAAGSKKGGALPANKTEDKGVEKTLEKVPYTDQDAENFTQDGEDKKVEDPYILKENADISQISDEQLGQAIRAYFQGLPEDERNKLISGIAQTQAQKPNTNAMPQQAAPSPEGVASAM